MKYYSMFYFEFH